MDENDQPLLAMRDLLDEQLVSADCVKLGRVADVEFEVRDGGPVLTTILTGPQALAGRIAEHLVGPARWLFRDRFDHRIPITEMENCGPTIRLRRNAADYAAGRSDRWLAAHLLRFIPGSGYHA